MDILFILFSYLLIFVIIIQTGYCDRNRHVKNVFLNPNQSEEFSHLSRDSRTGFLYIGATNNLFKLDKFLAINQTVSTGPKLDNINCLQIETCNFPLIHSQSYNKALLVDEKNEWLITCSNLYHGHCEHRSLDNMTEVTAVDRFEMSVVAKNKTATTVMFIGPGPQVSPDEVDVLYVGVEYVHLGIQSINNLAVSMRRLDNFKIFSKSISSKSAIAFDTLHREFPVSYKYGFSSGGFSYFVTVQKESATSGRFVSKLIRLCQRDKNFYSYMENKIKCSQNGKEYRFVQSAIIGKPGPLFTSNLGILSTEDVLFATFTSAPKGQTEGVLCAFSMRSVTSVFTRSIKRCFGGIGTTGPDHVTRPTSCISIGDRMVNNINDDYCGEFDFNTPIDGLEEISSEAIMKLELRVTSLSVYTAYKHTILFAGSSKGKVLQILVNNGSGLVFNSYDLELGQRILQDTAFDKDFENIYTFSRNAVYRIALSKCDYYKSCDKCIEDPHCGWCTLTARCTKKQECQGNQIPIKWIGYGFVCIKIIATSPSEISVNDDNEHQQVTMTTVSLPYGEKYNCAYKINGVELISTFNQTDNRNVTCELPEANEIPMFARDHILIRLVVQLDNIDIVGTEMTLFNCSTYTYCTSCTSSQFRCSWCINKHKCTHQHDLNCERNDNVILGHNSNYNNKNGSRNLGPAYCPLIKRDSDIYIASSHFTNVSVTAYNILPHQLPLQCYFGFDGGKTVSTKSFAITNNSLRIECDEVQMQYKENITFKTIPFKIFWGNKKSQNYLDNPDNVKVILYKCKFLGLTCGECLTLSEHFHCGWCSNRCEIHDGCSLEDWHIKPFVCPNVKITEIYPVYGHYRGNTHLTIDGRNLGTSISEITFIRVADVSCIPMKNNYIPSKRIVCKTGTYDMDVPGSGKVIISIANKFNASSANNFIFTKLTEQVLTFKWLLVFQIFFYYFTIICYTNYWPKDSEVLKDPTVASISPLFGPSSGGTTGIVLGEYLNTGSEISIIIGNKSCHIMQRNETSIAFLTPSHEEGNQQILITIDGHRLTDWSNVDKIFSYKADPTIESISPRKSFFAGFMDLLVIGTSFNSIVKPVMFVTYEEHGHFLRSLDSNCMISNESLMICPSPQIETSNLNKTLITTNASFVMDGVMSVQNMSVHFPDVDAKILYYKDPVVAPIASTFKDKLIIKGQFFGVIEMAVTVNITIDESYCKLTVIAVDELQCKLPDNVDRSGKIKVTIGDGMFEFYPELLKEISGDSINPSTIIAIFASIFMVIFFSILIPVLLMKRRNLMRKETLMTSERFQDLNNYQFLVQNNPDKIDMETQDNILETIIHFGLHIERKYLEVLDTLGQGQFGLVYKGRLQLDGEEQQDVAVKTVKGDNSGSIKEIVEEALLMKDFKHDNVLSIIGISISEKNLPLIVMPFMKNGDMLSYLRNERNSPSLAMLINFGLDIAKGMDYLSKTRYVHRDLAARNCMLDAQLVAKVGDFGLSRDIYSTDYYTCDNKKKLPYRWMAPECMEDGKCSEKTDVWSFGVVLWELMTRGSTPYTGVGNWEILACLKDGLRLPRSLYCPVPLYEVMLKCWNSDPAERPNFSLLEIEITDIISTCMSNKSLHPSADESYDSPLDIQKCRYYRNVSGSETENKPYIEFLPEQQQIVPSDNTENI